VRGFSKLNSNGGTSGGSTTFHVRKKTHEAEAHGNPDVIATQGATSLECDPASASLLKWHKVSVMHKVSLPSCRFAPPKS